MAEGLAASDFRRLDRTAVACVPPSPPFLLCMFVARCPSLFVFIIFIFFVRGVFLKGGLGPVGPMTQLRPSPAPGGQSRHARCACVHSRGLATLSDPAAF